MSLNFSFLISLFDFKNSSNLEVFLCFLADLRLHPKGERHAGQCNWWLLVCMYECKQNELSVYMCELFEWATKCLECTFHVIQCQLAPAHQKVSVINKQKQWHDVSSIQTCLICCCTRQRNAIYPQKMYMTLTLMVKLIYQNRFCFILSVDWWVQKIDGSCVCFVKLVYITLCKCATYKLRSCWAVDEVRPGVCEAHLHQTQSSQKSNRVYMTDALWVVKWENNTFIRLLFE